MGREVVYAKGSCVDTSITVELLFVVAILNTFDAVIVRYELEQAEVM